MLYIQAMNIHQGGGGMLLRSLIDALPPTVEAKLFVDERFRYEREWPHRLERHSIKPSLMSRIAAERRLAKIVEPGDLLLCLGNLPPLFPVSAKVVVYFHNRLLLDMAGSPRFAFKPRVRLWIERQWVRRFGHRANRWIVQTPSMERLVHERIGVSTESIEALGFLPRPQPAPAPRTLNCRDEPKHVLYPASGDPHKNHHRLIEAWRRLDEDGLRPVLNLTVDPRSYPELADAIEALRLRHVPLVNHGNLSPAALAELYGRADAVIFPSLVESFGLPLLEARQHGIPIIAGELDYVRDVCNPAETFDPQSAVSIARAVQRFIGTPNEVVDLLEPGSIWDRIGELTQR